MERHIQEYLIERVIREDIMGKVFLALHIPSAQRVLLRHIPASLQPAFTSQDSANNNLLVSLGHPGIGKFYTYIKYEDELYLVSEYISGSTLDQYLSFASQGLSEEKIWEIAMELINAFVYAHRKGIHHFTLHPGNIFLTADEKVKVIDFGLADLFISHLNDPKELNQVAYRSPEQIQGKLLDERSDIYTFGVILFQLLTRQIPYPDVLSPSIIQDKIVHHSFPPINLYTTAFAHNYTMQAIVDKATAKNPAYRFEDFQALKESLLEEKEEREALILDQLMQEVNQRSQLYPSEMISTITLARRKKTQKRISLSVLVVALMASALAIGVNITTSSSGSERMVEAQENSSSASIESSEPEGSTQAMKGDTPIKATDPTVAQQITPTPQQETISTQKLPSVGANDEQKIKERTLSHAGFSLALPSENHLIQLQLQTRVERFYAALRSKQISEMKGYYASTLTRFFNESNIHEKQLHSLLQKAWKRTPQDKHQILWDTFRYSYDEQGNYTIEFYMDYTYHRANRKNWRSRKIYTMIKMDKDLKIYYMAGD